MPLPPARHGLRAWRSADRRGDDDLSDIDSGNGIPRRSSDCRAHRISSGVLPSGGLEIINGQLQSLIDQDAEALSAGFLLGLAIALWSANSGIKNLFEGMNIAYGETEKRGLVMLNVLSLTFTMGAIFVGIGLIISVGIVPTALALLRLDQWTEILIRVLRWPLLLVMIGIGMTVLYRFGPSREKAKWRWLTWGSVLATIVWLIASWVFSYYLQNFADYNATYGTLGAVIGFMMWTWISVIILLVGAELNAELDRPPGTPPSDLPSQWGTEGLSWPTPSARHQMRLLRNLADNGPNPALNPLGTINFRRIF